jgi:hypothetical protein
MTGLRVIDGGKKAKRMAEARILECECTCRTFVEARTGILIDKDGKVVHKGALTRHCVSCGKLVN